MIWTSGGIDKLAIYQRLGIDEVWFWIAGRLQVHSLRMTLTNAWTVAVGCQEVLEMPAESAPSWSSA